ncbi:MAG: TRAP transporter substrate-binding protein [Chloroflexi bacterium]|nr:MAG: TRAP transporter substrate-binding protein [Chloroflexota bacterium]TMB98255.1 MAG: TRAP transporter substrate-binding protein [Chloroflexota bacterium]TMC30291.1 MAG: TRAP transporter substrate-binding protein [Chloroflexota bacterium]TMC34391.1 MAG: TRAP transporter substrate-binding protein [Chloroflexota bacterium]TMC59236.1 MAG: TRAP transporter substrate-binding protein [Chloroflexota bacterium]
MSVLSRLSRRSLLKYGSLSGLGAFITACLAQNAPTTSQAPGTGAAATSSGASSVAPAANAITWKIQSGWAGNDIFQTMFLNWKASVEEMSGGRIKIDALPVNTITNNNGMLDAVHAGTLDGAHEVPAYGPFQKDHAASLIGTGPMMGMSGQMWLSWYWYGGGQQLYQDLIQKKLKLNVVSFLHMPMQNQPLGWFKDEIKSPDDFKGMKFRTVGLATGIYQFMGASVINVAGADVASSLDRGVIDAAEFNNTTSDTAYGLPDVRKICMTQSYHQPSEILGLDLNKTKFDSMPKDLQAIMKWSVIAASADGEWIQMAKNSEDYAKLVARGIKFIKTPQSVRDSQLQAWDKVIADESKDNPEFVAILKSQKAWAERIFPWADTVNIRTPDPVSFAARPKV